MTIRKRLLIAFIGWMLIELAIFVYGVPHLRGRTLSKLWSLYWLAAGVWVLMPLLKIAGTAMDKEKARGSIHSDEG